jgi:hypothetical protein
MIWGFHGGEYGDGCLLGCRAVYTGLSLPTFLGDHRHFDGDSKDVWNVSKLMPRRYNPETAIFVLESPQRLCKSGIAVNLMRGQWRRAVCWCDRKPASIETEHRATRSVKSVLASKLAGGKWVCVECAALQCVQYRVTRPWLIVSDSEMDWKRRKNGNQQRTNISSGVIWVFSDAANKCNWSQLYRRCPTWTATRYTIT